MNRNTPLLTLAAATALALAACQDNAPTAPRSSATPLAAKGGNGNGNGNGNDATPAVGDASVQTLAGKAFLAAYPGNTTGDGTSECAKYGGGGTATKVDGDYDQTVAGYRFTASNGGTQLAFAPVTNGTQANAITAVILKGGPAYDVYAYYRDGSGNSAAGAVVTTDSRLTAPYNRGGNIPTISHYVVCSVPVTTTFSKTLTHVYATMNPMGDDRDWLADPDMLRILSGETRWLEYEISYTLPAGVTGTVTDGLNQQNCAAAAGAGFSCVFNAEQGGQSSWGSLSGTNHISFIVDLTNKDAKCDRPFTNRAVLKTSTGATFTAQASVMLWPADCPSS